MVNLSVKHRAFADNYIELGNAEQAAIKAGYSKTYARAQSYKLLENVGISAYINELMDEHKQKALWTREEAVSDLLWLRVKSRESIEEMGVRQANSNALLATIKELNTLEDLYPKKNAEPENKESEVADALRGLANGIKSITETE